MQSSIKFLLIACISSAVAYLGPGPKYTASVGEVWPKPMWQDDDGKYYGINPNTFTISIVNKNCDILQQAVQRYTAIIKQSAKSLIQAPSTPLNGTISVIKVNLTTPCETLPYLGMDESYYVWGDGRVIANSVWGILRGLETLSQIIVPMKNGLLRIPGTEIYDQPRFQHRGIMLDTSRHFFDLDKIYELLDGMAYNKLNVFHWHIVDDQSFPYNSTTFPELSTAGAYFSQMTYSVANVKSVIEYARARGIRVVAEFDTPGHTGSWGASHPEIMTACGGANLGKLGPLNPTSDVTFNFLRRLFTEIASIFPEKYLHLGIDEVDTDCWETNPQILAYLNANGKDIYDLPYMFIERFAAQINSLGKTPIVWQEALLENDGVTVPSNTIAEVWYDYQSALASITDQGYRAILSEGWWLLILDTGGDWEKFYTVEPTSFPGTTAQKNRVIGGEACLWSEFVNNNNVIPMTFPRGSAVAERLWSEKAITNVADATRRLEEHTCRMMLRGIHAQPANDYGFC